LKTNRRIFTAAAFRYMRSRDEYCLGGFFDRRHGGMGFVPEASLHLSPPPPDFAGGQAGFVIS
jgi:hypothetical protein